MEDSINLKDVIFLLRNKRKLIFRIVTACVALGVLYSLFIFVPKYPAEILIMNTSKDKSVSEIIVGPEGVSLKGDQKLIQSVAELSISQLVIEQVRKIENSDKDHKEFLQGVQVALVPGTEMVRITATDKNPQRAASRVTLIAETTLNEASKILDTKNIKIIQKAIVAQNPVNRMELLPTILVAAAIGVLGSIFIIFLIAYFSLFGKRKI